MFFHLVEDLKRRSLAQFVSPEVGGLGWAEKRLEGGNTVEVSPFLRCCLFCCQAK